DVPDALNRAMVPHFMLQPLVENALEHGIARRAGPGRVDVSAERVNGTLRLTVSDDGPGLSGGEGDSVRDGVGLSNTKRRLRELYGDRQDLAVEAGTSGSGLRVSVSIPYRQALA
ncbi:MAG: sensor histidine kinase, partial [Gemmatimonadota bacterium]|nr:sensor histidine kinase [Gemmatimonadota bacterium]